MIVKTAEIFTLTLKVIFWEATILFGKLEYSFFIHYAINKEKMTWHETSGLKLIVSHSKQEVQNGLTNNSSFQKNK